MTDFVYALLLIGAAALWVPIVAFWVHVYRSEGTPQTPIGGTATPRTVPPIGPQQPVSASPTPDRGTDRCRRTVAPGVPDPSTTVAPRGEAS